MATMVKPTQKVLDAALCASVKKEMAKPPTSNSARKDEASLAQARNALVVLPGVPAVVARRSAPALKKRLALVVRPPTKR